MKKLSVLFLALIALFIWTVPSHAANGVKKTPIAHRAKKVDKKVKKEEKKELKKEEGKKEETKEKVEPKVNM
ncbi:MAG: hypothetical protein NTZ95_01275 [Candidatus Omnitrophica bacterium]|nr:hypothetical protein [Candidatus Omnitrophota bacterium]